MPFRGRAVDFTIPKHYHKATFLFNIVAGSREASNGNAEQYQNKKGGWSMHYHECNICNSAYRTKPFKAGYICEECLKYVSGIK